MSKTSNALKSKSTSEIIYLSTQVMVFSHSLHAFVAEIVGQFLSKIAKKSPVATSGLSQGMKTKRCGLTTPDRHPWRRSRTNKRLTSTGIHVVATPRPADYPFQFLGRRWRLESATEKDRISGKCIGVKRNHLHVLYGGGIWYFRGWNGLRMSVVISFSGGMGCVKCFGLPNS